MGPGRKVRRLLIVYFGNRASSAPVNSDAVFQSLPPPSALAGRAAALHFHSGASNGRPFRRLPAPFAALVIHAGDPGLWRRAGETRWRPYPRVALHGLATTWSEAVQSPGSPYLMALIEPWAVESLFGLAAATTIDEVTDLGACDTLQAVSRCLDPDDLATALEERAASSPPTGLAPLFAKARQAAGSVRVDIAARSAGLDERTLRRVFRSCVGVNPKRWFEIERFAANLRRLHPAPWDDRSAHPDYFDQAHEIREFRRFAGVTPGAYAKEKRAGDRRVFALG